MNLKAGLYSVLIIDSIGQSYADSFVLIEPDSISISYIVSNVTGIGLSNGSIDITPFPLKVDSNWCLLSIINVITFSSSGLSH